MGYNVQKHHIPKRNIVSTIHNKGLQCSEKATSPYVRVIKKIEVNIILKCRMLKVNTLHWSSHAASGWHTLRHHLVTLATAGTLDSLVHAQYEAGGFGGRCECIEFHERGLPHAGRHIVRHVPGSHVHAPPG